MEALFNIVEFADSAVLAAGAVFVRISAMFFFMPGLGEQVIPMRVRLGGALAFAAIIWPMTLPSAPELTMTFDSLGVIYLAEAVVGLTLGLSLRFLVFALQTAGALAAQSLSLNQMFGAGVSPEPEPTIGTILTMGAIVIALGLGLHVKVAALLVESYQVLPFGDFPVGGDMAEWSSARASQAFGLAVSLALPFIILSFVYNLALGAINRAMPQLMVAFIGMPAITGLGLALLTATVGLTITLWQNRLDAVLAAPLALNP
ncbi:MAG: flagellar biosynthetic protein FliR [Rhodobacteraceae bacterium]|nr:flagellar biosynthetic protein FliR [Paracoccaceae bacterium]